MLQFMPHKAAGMYRNRRKRQAPSFLSLCLILSLQVSPSAVAPHSYQLAALSLFSFHSPGGKSFGQKQHGCVSSCSCGQVRVKPFPSRRGEQWDRLGGLM